MEDVPVLTKQNLQIPKSRLSKGFSTNNSFTNKTSGSSGTPLVLPKINTHTLLLGRLICIVLVGSESILIVRTKHGFMAFH
jgi:phenylacetate-coenzyme A ligase PaaK-like adenylate-forming protein